MPDDMSSLRDEVARLREAVAAAPTPKPGKDVWETLATLSSLLSSVILGAVGLYATAVYNNHQLAQAAKEQADKALIERADVLDKYSHYVMSADMQQRTFGYGMFVTLGQGDLALKIIALNKDQAGVSVVEHLAASDDTDLRNAARKLLPRLQFVAPVVAQFEGPVALKPYQDPFGIWAIGYGHTKGVTADTPPITADQAMELLGKDLEPCDAALDRLATVPLTLHQRAALVSLMFNIGTGPFSRSLVLQVVNRGQFDAVPDAFRAWAKAGDGSVREGLKRRRELEISIWNTPDTPPG